MAEMGRDAFMSRNYRLAAEIHEECLKQKDTSVELNFGYGNSLARCGRLREALDVFSHCSRLQSGNDGGFVTQEKLRHLATALLDAIITNTAGPSSSPAGGFECRICEGILLQPVTTACGHTFCRRCLARDASRSCRQCGQKIASGVLETNVLMKGLSEKWWPEEVRAARLREEGSELFQRNEVDAAMAKYGEALQIAPTNHLVLSNRSHALLRLNRFQAALDDADTIVRLCPTWGKGHYRRGMALTSLGRHEDALLSFSVCLALDHDMGAVHHEVTLALHRLLVGAPDGFRARCHSLGVLAPYSLQGRRPRFLASSYPALNSSDYEDSSSGDEDFQAPHRLASTSLGGSTAPLVPQENTRLHCLIDHIFQEVDRIKRMDVKLMDLSVNPDLVDPADFDCVLCCRTLWQPVTTPCGHTYCWMCLDRCLDYSFACPLCMTSLADYLATSQKAVTEVIEHSLRLLLPAEYLARQVTHHQELSELVQLWGGQVPVFVCTTGFPGVPCPLYVYEPRYRVMMRHCAEAGTREFGIVACLTKDPGNKSYAEFGTMLEIRDWILLDNGCSILTTVGVQRFHILTRGERDGYDTAKVEYFRDQPIPADRLPDLKDLHDRVHPKAWQWFTSLEAELQSEIVRAFGHMPELEEEWPSLADGPAWTWWLLAFLPLSQELKVEILATTSLEKRLRAIDKTLDRIQAATAARQEQEVAVAARHEQQTSNSEHQAGPRQQTGETFDQQEQQNQHVVTAGHQLPPHIFNSRFLGANRERVGVMGTS